MTTTEGTLSHATVHTVLGGDGLALHVREWGPPDGPPVLLIHGWSGNHMCWRHQVDSALVEEFRLVALDLRGHGMSDRPLDAGRYQDARLWAADIAAVIEQLDLDRPTLVGWSYGGFVICDYLRAYGESADLGDQLRRSRRQPERTLRRHRTRLPEQRPGRGRSRPADQDRGPAPVLAEHERGPAGSDRLRNRSLRERVRAASGARRVDLAPDRLRPGAGPDQPSPSWSPTAARTRSSCPPWPNTSSRPARRPRHPGTTGSDTSRSPRTRHASTTSWPS